MINNIENKCQQLWTCVKSRHCYPRNSFDAFHSTLTILRETACEIEKFN